ncbi:voltage-dependent calcium channel subunit alpha-2/delta-3-like isoform X2 [Periplaneta americana]|uniref:voltage-dependent calcium channel subunit alpha-2/delta-3-like isoform X2 n=1 Tax=Periplaneta americana TaxID=6978 RepID=UPI0037E81461
MAVNLRSVVRASCLLAVLCLVGGADNDLAFSLLERENIKNWADVLGDELWKLGQSVTRAPEIKARYQKLNVRVQEKDGEGLLKEIADTVERMLNRKMDAVKCIMSAAEDAAEGFNRSDVPANYTFYSAKHSFIVGEAHRSVYEDNNTYTPMELRPDYHFYNIPVNVNHSCVHVPTNVYDMAEPVLDIIKWSEVLDDVFIHNYYSDPGLSFQYFGSSYGLLRSYPAMKWRGDPDLFDCRNRYWYIQAATCTKDLVILMDNSGSMTGYRNTIARLTVSNILDTLNNNDFVNVFNYSEKTDEAVPCFKDMLVQATLENVNTLKDAVENIKPEGYANLTYAFNKAFQLLERYRELRGCSNSSEGVQCNQAIMLVTDGVSGNHTEVFEAWNWQDNNTYIPVRVFTFLIGQEVTKVREIQWMACLNRGYYVHIHSMNEVKEQVFKYIPVIARPLVLQEMIHPSIWTPAYADTTDPTLAAWLWDVSVNTKEHKKQLSKHARNTDQYFSQGKEDHIYIRDPTQQNGGKEEPKLQEYRVMVSVSVPAFDRKTNSYVSNETRLAELLGVAGTDVPIKDMEKLTYNYKSGVNGYAFIVTNNGYILLHPDLRPVFRGVLKENYNSVDLTEVELLDDTRGPRELSPEIIELRNAMVNHSEGKMLNLKMKFHYDDIRRVAVEEKNYYYAPLKGTPFTMGLSLPAKYGMQHIRAGDEVQKSRHKKIPIINYLKGSGWKIHPEWTYCKYHHQTRTFDSPEEELSHFLDKMRRPDWVWAERYEREEDIDELALMQDSLVFFVENGTETVNCNRRLVGEDEYYCDRELVQLFTFDARVTEPFFKDAALTPRTELEEELVSLYNVTLKFVSTQSGLTRWIRVQDRPESEEGGLDFGDLHTNSIDEPWYRSAVLQHEKDPESYVISVPFDAGIRDDAVVMASHAIFPRDGGLQAPASVVGLQFPHSALLSRFMTITSQINCPVCFECASEELDCFVLDNNGYVVLSEDQNSTGRFFGELEGAIMNDLRTGEDAVFKKVPVFDYQGLCFDEVRKITSDANFLLSPFSQLKLMVQWVFGHVLWLLLESSLAQLWYGAHTTAASMPEIEGPAQEKVVIIQVPRPCDQKTSLYLLQDDMLDKYAYSHDQCSRPHMVQRIPRTNLVLVVIKSMFQTCFKKVTSSPLEIHYNGTDHPCQKLLLNDLPRRRLSGCFSENPLEQEVKLCGDSGRAVLSASVWLAACLAHWLRR